MQETGVSEFTFCDIFAIYCACTDIILLFETHGIGQTPSSFERCVVVCPMQCMALNRYKITRVYVCLSVCLSAIPFVDDSARSFCPIFLKFGT